MKRVIALFAVAMVASLVVGCEKERNPEYYVLDFSARVVDTEGNPIQGICAYPEGAEFEGRSGYSNYMGELSGFAHIAPRKRLIICFEDVDGAPYSFDNSSTLSHCHPHPKPQHP